MSTHEIVQNTTQLGQRFIVCACGHTVTGGVGDTIAEQNMAFHISEARKAEQPTLIEKRLAEVAARKAELLDQLPDDDARNEVYRAAIREQNTRGGRFTERLAEEVANFLDAHRDQLAEPGRQTVLAHLEHVQKGGPGHTWQHLHSEHKVSQGSLAGLTSDEMLRKHAEMHQAAASDQWEATHPPVDGDDRSPLEVLQAGLITEAEFWTLVKP